jgi:galactonate dehydratase
VQNLPSRRDLFRSAIGAGALQGFNLSAQPAGHAPGRVKITGFKIHKATVRWRDLVFLEVQTDAGLTGIGEATLEGRSAQVETALQWLEDDFTGRDPAGAEEHWNRAYYQLSRWRNGPDAFTALSAVDIALWDIEAKRLNVPLWQLLGGRLQEKSRVYYTHWSASLENHRVPSAFRDWATETKEKGWTAVKWTLSARGSESERIAAASSEFQAFRDAVGNSIDFGIEAAETFSIRSAIDFARAVERFHPLFLEEPALRENSIGLGEIAAKSPVAIATGEGLFSRSEFLPLLEARGASIIQPDVLHAGGITEIRKIASLAETYGVEIAPHQCSGPIAQVASLTAMSCCRNFLIQEWEAADDVAFRELSDGTYPVPQQGFVMLPNAPGLGLKLNFDEFTKRFPFRPSKRHSLIK